MRRLGEGAGTKSRKEDERRRGRTGPGWMRRELPESRARRELTSELSLQLKAFWEGKKEVCGVRQMEGCRAGPQVVRWSVHKGTSCQHQDTTRSVTAEPNVPVLGDGFSLQSSRPMLDLVPSVSISTTARRRSRERQGTEPPTSGLSSSCSTVLNC